MLRVGHRGARAYAPENTLASFKKALELGVDAVELDVRKTKDNQIVVIHDADVKRTTDGEGLVNELTLGQIKSFSAEGGGENSHSGGSAGFSGQEGESADRIERTWR
jgi:glycerophosphoryl diester phosphodiesterase